MKLANLLADGQLNNTIFDLNSPNNLDNWHYPYWLLRSLFESYGVELNTSDVNDTENIIFELHQDVRKQINNNVPCYVMLYETPHIRPINKDKYLLAKYKRIFTWRYDWVDGQRYIKFNAPNRIVVNNSRGWAGRDKLCCLIAGNKSVPQITTLELYSERVKTIKWFEMHAPEDFDLFGHGWNKPAAHPGLLGKLDRKLRCILPKQSGKIYFPSYRGKATSKLETLQKYRFNLCYENVKDLKGYITEKIFDSFFLVVSLCIGEHPTLTNTFQKAVLSIVGNLLVTRICITSWFPCQNQNS